MFDLDGGIQLEELGHQFVGILLGHADIHEADTRIVQEQRTELSLLALLIGSRGELGDMQRILLILIIRDGTPLLVHLVAPQQVLPEEQGAVHEAEP